MSLNFDFFILKVPIIKNRRKEVCQTGTYEKSTFQDSLIPKFQVKPTHIHSFNLNFLNIFSENCFVSFCVIFLMYLVSSCIIKTSNEFR